jgi:hypothetical protein
LAWKNELWDLSPRVQDVFVGVVWRVYGFHFLECAKKGKKCQTEKNFVLLARGVWGSTGATGAVETCQFWKMPSKKSNLKSANLGKNAKNEKSPKFFSIKCNLLCTYTNFDKFHQFL